MRVFVTTLGVLIFVVLLPDLAFAQASITGVVRDASGAILPGVTVEASSPALDRKGALRDDGWDAGSIESTTCGLAFTPSCFPWAAFQHAAPRRRSSSRARSLRP